MSIIHHSEGMISMDAENVEIDKETIEFLEQTDLYKKLVSRFGKEKAEEIIKKTHKCERGEPMETEGKQDRQRSGRQYPLGALTPEWKKRMYANYINGAWMNAAGAHYIESLDPATLELVGVVPRSGDAEINLAVSAAKAALPKWCNVPAPKRAEILFEAARRLQAEKMSLSWLMAREMGKPLKEAEGEVQEAIDMAYYIAGEGRRLFGQTTPSEMPNKLAMTVREPVGVCAVITPWNFPIAIPVWKIWPALVCGNTVVFKPAEDTPVCVNYLIQILLEAGFYKYPGVINLVNGYGEETGRLLVSHPDVDLISFTGSSDVGHEIEMVCASYKKRCSLEMGGKNAIIVMDDADLELAVEGAVWAAFGTSGQRCTAASRIIVQKNIAKEFTEKFRIRTLKLRVGNGIKKEIDVGPLINQAAFEKVKKYVNIGRQEGAKIICGGRPMSYKNHKLFDLKGYFYIPTIFVDVKPEMVIAQEEIFGPVTCVIECNDLDDAIRIANGVEYGLSNAIFTSDINKAMKFIKESKSGLVYVNQGTTGAEVHLPFGGVKQTGNGHREGLHVLDIFTEWKTVYIDYSGVLQRAQIDNS